MNNEEQIIAGIEELAHQINELKKQATSTQKNDNIDLISNKIKKIEDIVLIYQITEL